MKCTLVVILFLRVAQLIEDEQNGLAAKMLTNCGWNNQEKIAWESLGHGDKNAMFEMGIRLIKNLDVNNQLDRLTTSTPDPQIILRFFSNFEELVDNADECDPDHLFRNQFEHGPMGTLYAGLCFINNQRIAFKIRSAPTGLDQIQ